MTDSIFARSCISRLGTVQDLFCTSLRTVLLTSLLTSLLTACGSESNETPAYVGSSTCQSCHKAEYQSWMSSDHALAMAEATDSTVLGSFDGAVFSDLGTKAVFKKSDDSFMIESHDSNGSVDTLAAEYTFGHYPLQQMLVQHERGRLQAFTVAWSTVDSSWISLYPDENLARGDYVHWSGPGMNWNYMCAECHSTNLKKGYRFDSNSYRTTYSEINVACEACHGPGEQHVLWANRVAPTLDSVAVSQANPSERGLTFSLRASSPSSTELEVCAQCHSRRTPISDSYDPGDRFLDHFRFSLLEEGLYYADGQINDEVYVYGSFLQSKMFRRGVRCSNCHNAHSGKIRFLGNALCAQCHVAADYDSAEHLRHKQGTEAAQCVTCHMPATTYMRVDPRRDHAFKIPRPEVSARIGAPDPCSSCHADRTTQMLAADIHAWNPELARADTTTLPEILFLARATDETALPLVNTVLRDTSVSPIMRATLVSLVGRYPVQSALGLVARELRNPEPLIRLGALIAADDLGPYAATALFEPLLADSIEGVRLEAARILSLRGTDDAADGIEGYDEALEDYRASLWVNADQPGTHVNLAVLEEALGNPQTARQSYKNALALDSLYTPALVNLALLFNRSLLDPDQAFPEAERSEIRLEAERLFKLAAESDDEIGGRAAYYLGLLLAEDASRMIEAAGFLERAALLLETDSRMYYNAGLAFQTVEDAEKAELYLKKAAVLSPADPDPVNALVIFYMQKEDWRRANEENDRLAGLTNQDPGVSERGVFINQQLEKMEQDWEK